MGVDQHRFIRQLKRSEPRPRSSLLLDTKHFGLSKVIGRSRVPRPAASSRARKGFFIPGLVQVVLGR